MARNAYTGGHWREMQELARALRSHRETLGELNF